jgi:hypothetical protein
VFDADVKISKVLGLVFGRDKELIQSTGDVDLVHRTGGSGHFGYFLDLGFYGQGKGFHADACSGKHRRHESPFLLQQCEHQVLNIDLLIAVSGRESLRISHGLLGLFSKSVHVHLVLYLDSDA